MATRRLDVAPHKLKHAAGRGLLRHHPTSIPLTRLGGAQTSDRLGLGSQHSRAG
jgi:hypothetical protein